MRANLAIFKDIFGGDFFSHVILVFTRWGYDPRSVRDRDRDGKYEVCAHKVTLYFGNFEELGTQTQFFKYLMEVHLSCIFLCSKYQDFRIDKRKAVGDKKNG